MPHPSNWTLCPPARHAAQVSLAQLLNDNQHCTLVLKLEMLLALAKQTLRILAQHAAQPLCHQQAALGGLQMQAAI